MAITRSDLRNKIRDKLDDWWRDQTTINEGGVFSDSDTTLTVTDGTKVIAGDLLEIEDEVLRVTDVSSNDLTVIRGWKGTTAASHADSTIVYIEPKWTQKEYNDAITQAFRSPYLHIPYVGNVRDYGNRIVLDDCDTADFTEGGDATAETLNTSDKKEGTASLNLGATYSTGSATYTKTLGASVDATGLEYLNLWVYVGAKQDANEDYYYDPTQFCEIRIGNDASNYASINVRLDEVRKGQWTLLNLNLLDFTTTGTWDRTATDYLYVDFKVLQDVTLGDLKMDEWFLSTYPLTTNKLQYRLPKNVLRLDDVRIYQDEDTTHFYQERRWDVKGDYLIFRIDIDRGNYSQTIEQLSRNQRRTMYFPENKPIELFGIKTPDVPSADSDTIDLEEEKEEMIILHAAIGLVEKKLAERSDFTKFNASANKGDMSVLNIIRIMNQLKSRLSELETKYEDLGGTIDMDYGQ